jgi:hypothetical protein
MLIARVDSPRNVGYPSPRRASTGDTRSARSVGAAHAAPGHLIVRPQCAALGRWDAKALHLEVVRDVGEISHALPIKTQCS